MTDDHSKHQQAEELFPDQATMNRELGELRQANVDLERLLSERSAELEQTLRRYRRIFERTKDVVIVSTPTGRLIDINPAGLELYDFESVDAMQRLDLRETMWANPADRDEYVRQLQEFGFVKGFEAEHKTRTGEVITVVGTTSLVLDDDDRIVELLTILRDITEKKRLARELERLARTDSLTGLANRGTFRDRLDLELDRMHHGGAPCCLMMLDVDYLKEINDTYGHHAGDAVLVGIAERFSEEIQEGDVLGRLGGDELALIVADVANEAHATSIAARLIASLDEPIPVGDQAIRASISVGIALARNGETEADRLMQRADRALYRAKGRGRAQASL